MRATRRSTLLCLAIDAAAQSFVVVHDETYTKLKKELAGELAQEFTDHINSLDTHVRFTTEGK